MTFNWHTGSDGGRSTIGLGVGTGTHGADGGGGFECVESRWGGRSAKVKDNPRSRSKRKIKVFKIFVRNEKRRVINSQRSSGRWIRVNGPLPLDGKKEIFDCGEVGEVYFGDRIKSPAGFLLIYEVKFWYVYYFLLNLSISNCFLPQNLKFLIETACVMQFTSMAKNRHRTSPGHLWGSDS